MAVAVFMPRQGNTVESCIITNWNKKPGDPVAVGDVLFSYETDKAAFEEEAQVPGTLLKVLGAVTGVLFIVYFWNLDQKLLGWSYVQVNKIFDRKEADIKF
ncbi:MAG: lipoyl domain-containing protein [Firmicutes bacterium]|nr:lipoyl domain-containing protein [Bacillota bacterium]